MAAAGGTVREPRALIAPAWAYYVLFLVAPLATPSTGGHVVDPQTRAVHARIELPNPDNALRPGMFAHVTLRSAAQGAADNLFTETLCFECANP